MKGITQCADIDTVAGLIGLESAEHAPALKRIYLDREKHVVRRRVSQSLSQALQLEAAERGAFNLSTRCT